MWYVKAAACVFALVIVSFGCGPKVDRTGHKETGIYIDCDPNGFTVKNEGNISRYLNFTEFCTLNTKQIKGMRPGGELPDLVMYSSETHQPMPFTSTVPAGGSARHDLKLKEIGHCMDQTMAPPGSTDGQVFSLISDGPADAVHMHLHIIWNESGRDRRSSMHVACKW